MATALARSNSGRFLPAARRAVSGGRTVVRRVVTRAAPVVRRAGKAAVGAALDEKHTLIAVGTAGVAGYMRGKGQLQDLPHIEKLGVEGTYGAAAFVIAKVTKSRIARHVATGLLAVAANRWGEEQGRDSGTSTSTTTPTTTSGTDRREITF